MLSKHVTFTGLLLATLGFGLQSLKAEWYPPSEIFRQEIIEASEEVLAMPDLPISAEEDLYRIRAVEMEWDMGAMVYQPQDDSKIPTDPAGRKIGLFLIHGGSGDHRSKDKEARFLSSKFGFKIVSMTYPGRLYLMDPDRYWPGDTIKPDGSVRTPIWHRDKPITRDQYDLVEETSLRPKYGTLLLARAKPGTEFYNRMSGWPVAFEEAGKDLMARHFPAGEYSIYIHGHSTGGPFCFMLTQRVPNIVGVLGMETTPFGYIGRVQARPSGNPTGKTYGDMPFNSLVIRTWRDKARYMGPEALMGEGPEALMRLPMLMEEVHESWERTKALPNFKGEGPISFGSIQGLTEAAQATAKRLNLNLEETQALVDQYVGYSRELRGLNVKPVPPVIFGIALASADHTPYNYRKITLPMLAAMAPPPKVRLVEFKAGIHGYSRPEPDLPMGPFPAVVKLWNEAIMKGYYLDYAKKWGALGP